MSTTPNEVVKEHITKLRIKELSECLDRLGMKKQGRKEDLQRRLLTVIDECSNLSYMGLQDRSLSQLEATKRIVEEIYGRYMIEKYTPTQRAPYAQRAEGSGSHVPPIANGSSNPHRQPPNFQIPPKPNVGAARWPIPDGTPNTAPRPSNLLGFPPQQPPSYPNLMQAGGAPGSSCYMAPQSAAATGPCPQAGSVVRCICEQPTARHGELLQCTSCQVFQHARCVTKPDARVSAPPHMCEKCRAERIDPFWEVVSSDIMPAFKLVPTGKTAYVGTKLEPVQTAERTFTLSPQQYELFKKRPNHKLQVACMQLNDPVQFRCLWPLASDLRVNNLQLQVYNRGSYTKTGKNQRDEPANIGVLCHPSRNRISMSCVDPASYVLLPQIVRQRSVDEVKRLTKPPLPLPAAIERVKQEIKSSDEDIEVDHAVVSLKCPLTGGRFKTPARFSEIQGLMYFDLDAFLSVAQRSRKWQCPNSMRNSSVYSLQVDSFMSSILGSLENMPDVAEVQVSPQGQWRPVGGPGAKGSGSSWPWIDAGVAPSALPLPSSTGQAAGKPMVKEEPQDGARPADISDEEDEAAEMKKAVQAIQSHQRRAKQQAELIVISSSDDDEAYVPPPSKRPRPAAPLPPAPSPSVPASGSIRVRVRPPASLTSQSPNPTATQARPFPTHSHPQANPPLPSHPPPPLPAVPHAPSPNATQQPGMQPAPHTNATPATLSPSTSSAPHASVPFSAHPLASTCSRPIGTLYPPSSSSSSSLPLSVSVSASLPLTHMSAAVPQPLPIAPSMLPAIPGTQPASGTQLGNASHSTLPPALPLSVRAVNGPANLDGAAVQGVHAPVGSGSADGFPGGPAASVPARSHAAVLKQMQHHLRVHLQQQQPEIKPPSQQTMQHQHQLQQQLLHLQHQLAQHQAQAQQQPHLQQPHNQHSPPASSAALPFTSSPFSYTSAAFPMQGSCLPIQSSPFSSHLPSLSTSVPPQPPSAPFYPLPVPQPAPQQQHHQHPHLQPLWAQLPAPAPASSSPAPFAEWCGLGNVASGNEAAPVKTSMAGSGATRPNWSLLPAPQHAREQQPPPRQQGAQLEVIVISDNSD